MVRPTSITQEQVNAIADTLRTNAIKPTARALREQLGSGSMATVVKMLQVWHSNQPRVEDSVPTLPPALQRVLIDFISQEITCSRNELQSELAAIQQINQDLIAESERQEHMITDLTEAHELLLAEKSTLMGRLGQMDAELRTLRDDATSERNAAEHARTELAKTLLRLEPMPKIEKSLEELQKKLQQESGAKIAAEKQAAVLDAKLEAEITAHQKVELNNAALMNRLDAMTHDLNQALSKSKTDVPKKSDTGQK